MKYTSLAALLFAANMAYAADAANNEWQETTLKEETIQKIQQAQFTYKKCVVEAMQKSEFSKMESRNATDVIIKQCEPTLSEMRQVYIDAAVPGVIADRHLKKLRIQVTRNLLQELMYLEAARKAGQTQ